MIGHPATAGKGRLANNPRLLWAAIAIAAPIAIIQLSETLSAYLWWVVSLRPHTTLLDKTDLGLLRIVSFFALLIVVRRLLPAPGVLSRHPLALATIRCGKASLQVFSLGVLLSSLTVVTAIFSADNFVVQALVCIVGVVAQFAYAAWRDRQKEERALSEGMVMSGPRDLRCSS